MMLNLEEFETEGVRYIRAAAESQRHLFTHLINGAGGCCYATELENVTSLALAHGWTVYTQRAAVADAGEPTPETGATETAQPPSIREATDDTPPVPVANYYSWQERNRLRAFASWEAEIAHAKAQGFRLVPPDYHVPDWVTAMAMKDALPVLHVLRAGGSMDKLNTAFDRPAHDIGYPLFFKVPSAPAGLGS